MAKLVNIECPKCARINTAKVGFFHRNKIKCECGNVINVKANLVKTRECPHCGNLIVFNRIKTDNPICPVCKQLLLDGKEDYKLCEVVCPTCSCHIVANKNEKVTTCPICETSIDIETRLREQQYIEQSHPTLLKCEASGDVLIWKHPLEDFALGSQIIVNESQVAIFLRDGKSLGIFESGRHMVTLNHLMLSKTNYSEDDVSFHSQLFYVAKTIQTGFKWGTDSKIRMFDPASGLHVELGAYGGYNFAIKNYEKFLFNTIGVGNISSLGIRPEEINPKIRPAIVNVVKSQVAKTIRENNINILEVDEYLDTIAASLTEVINASVEKLGIEVLDFTISVTTPDDDPNFKRMKEQFAERYLKVQDERIKQAEAEAAHSRILTELNTEADVELTRAKIAAEKERILAQGSADAYKAQAEAEAEEMKMKGYSYDDETRRQVSNKVADSMSSHGYGGSENNSLFTGMTQDAVKANIIKEASKEMSKDIMSTFKNGEGVEPIKETKPNSWDCKECGTVGITSNFCPNCGAKKQVIETWTCPKCGASEITSKFCPDCGEPKPETWVCPDCGTKDIKSKFCPNCGRRKE